MLTNGLLVAITLRLQPKDDTDTLIIGVQEHQRPGATIPDRIQDAGCGEKPLRQSST